MIAKILAVSAFVACAQAGVFELGGHGASSYTSINHAPTVIKAPVAYAAPVATYHQVPTVVKALAPVVKEIYPDAYPKYTFEYGIQDGHTGDVKNQQEERDGDVVKGYYTIVQPDGVTRVVHYTADDHNGFNAQVEYQGQPVQKAVITKAIIPTKTIILAVFAFIACVQAGYYGGGHQASSYSSINHGPTVVKTIAPVAHYAPVVKAIHQEVYPDAYPQYSFQYAVQDAHTGDSKNQHEERDGDVVKGYYTLVQPDGVTRIVHYTADAHNGFNAEVEYKGQPVVQKTFVAKAIIPSYNAYHH
ncbi:PREDICTED: cuticle protein 19.8-like [Nicrophorus vespilloides]|uniref:Cuticle protein 19.8-like n=1 Tax=Nicrophorus vespilloides TaxID=110193 RepID=A0ABM1ND13_NICVS|nr:PREDICTED: cuticle protein 19.8-like [Nicrophorus vespilloides]